MKWLDRISIKSRLTIAISLFLALFIIFGLFSLDQITRLGDLTTTLYEHPLRVSNAALRASLEVVKMHKSLGNMILSESAFELDEAVQAIRIEEKTVLDNLDIIQKYILGREGEALERETRALFTQWQPVRNEVISLAMAGKKDEAVKVFKAKGAEFVRDLEHKTSALTSYARNKADGFFANSLEIRKNIQDRTILFIVLVGLFSLITGFLVLNSILVSVDALKNTMSDITRTGQLVKSELGGNNELTDMARHFNLLIDRLEHEFWIKDGQNGLGEELSGDLSQEDLVTRSLVFVARYVKACTGAFYVYDAGQSLLELKASFAFVERKQLSNRFKPGEGIVGQVALERTPILLTGITRDQALGVSGTVSEAPRTIYAVPLIYKKELCGVLEVASFETLDQTKTEFLDMAATAIASYLFNSFQNQKIKQLYEDARESNKALEAKTMELNRSNEELASVNEELQSQSEELHVQTEELKIQARELERRRLQVEEADRLKSEFLSNMSHELRTPLNSILALSQLMIMKGTGKNREQETEYLKVIERNGRHLLNLINDILDLSKIESGRLEINPEEVDLRAAVDRILETIRPLAREKGLGLKVKAENLVSIRTDQEKLHQILLNLMSNAVKFTERGQIELEIITEPTRVRFVVRDTGIGIAEEDLAGVFDEFRQIDGSSTRKFQGTGLGLAICRKLALMIGGDVLLESELGHGSVFTLTLPRQISDSPYGKARPAPEAKPTIDWEPYSPDQKLDRKILIIDDDPEICELIVNYLSHTGFEGVVAVNGRQGLKLARTIKPYAITLDLAMPDLAGWEVLQQLKLSRETANIPVIIISATEDRTTGTALGATGYLVKPVEKNCLLKELDRIGFTRKIGRVLVVDDEPAVRAMVETTLVEKDYTVASASNGREALDLVRRNPPDAMILDLIMPELDGFGVLEKIGADPINSNIPVIILTSKDLTRDEKRILEQRANKIIVKGRMEKEKLLDELEVALARIERMRLSRADGRPLFLVIEDNKVAALQISEALEENGYSVLQAGGGAEAMKILYNTVPDGIVLDLMMPGMDGFEVLEKIKSLPQLAGVPVLVLTARDLSPEDRDRLKYDNIQQLIQKGSLDREQLVARIRGVFGPKIPAPSEKQGLSFDSEVIDRGPFQKMILLAEDNPDNRISMEAVLEEGGYECRSVQDGEEAVRAAAELKPDLILMDIQLPLLNGLEAARRIKANPKLAGIPILALTARAMKGEKEKLIGQGMNDYLAKPINPEDLLRILKKWIG